MTCDAGQTTVQGLTPYNDNLVGTIPASLEKLTNLLDLNLSRNHLAGAIPSELGNLSRLQNLNLWSNQLAGQIPTSLGNLTNLTSLALGSNQLTGPIPEELGNLTNLARTQPERQPAHRLDPTRSRLSHQPLGPRDGLEPAHGSNPASTW